MATADCVDSDGKQFGRTRSESKRLEPWKRHIIGQLKHRDQAQKIRFQDLICSYLNLLEHCTRNTLIAKGLFSFPRLHSSFKDVSSLKTSTGELAYQVVELQQKIKIKNAFLDEQQIKVAVGTIHQA
ncbi:protein Atg16l2 [Trichomycterus rosablanca]|uniref:protein Atg16l2 n=1 Tax=Trichomycterus rosablanca TaxID=2290929 RepID=UPI002F35534D